MTRALLLVSLHRIVPPSIAQPTVSSIQPASMWAAVGEQDSYCTTTSPTTPELLRRGGSGSDRLIWQCIMPNEATYRYLVGPNRYSGLSEERFRPTG